MSERRLLEGRTITNSTAQDAEAQLRQALDHMGGNRSGGNSGSNGGSQAGSMRSGGSPATTRHRYVRDGEVPVVHATLGRQPARPDPSIQQDKALVEALRQDLDRERAAREAAERALQETRATLVTLQTRLAHVEIDLQETQAQAQTQAQAHEQAVAEAAAPAVNAVEPEPAPERIRRKPKAERPARVPQPIKWWIKGE